MILTYSTIKILFHIVGPISDESIDEACEYSLNNELTVVISRTSSKHAKRTTFKLSSSCYLIENIDPGIYQTQSKKSRNIARFVSNMQLPSFFDSQGFTHVLRVRSDSPILESSESLNSAISKLKKFINISSLDHKAQIALVPKKGSKKSVFYRSCIPYTSDLFIFCTIHLYHDLTRSSLPFMLRVFEGTNYHSEEIYGSSLNLSCLKLNHQIIYRNISLFIPEQFMPKPRVDKIKGYLSYLFYDKL